MKSSPGLTNIQSSGMGAYYKDRIVPSKGDPSLQAKLKGLHSGNLLLAISAAGKVGWSALADLLCGLVLLINLLDSLLE